MTAEENANERELLHRWLDDRGMPPFPGLDLFDPIDRALWFGDGQGVRKLDFDIQVEGDM